MEITANEITIIKLLRELKPFEVIEVRKDRDGKPDFYLVRREQKIILNK